MDKIKQFENTISKWLKPLPHLPIHIRKLLADNVWLITLLGIILSVIAIFSIISAIMIGMWGVSIVDNYSSTVGGVIAYRGIDAFWALITLILSIVNVAIMIKAVNLLRFYKVKGWDLLFLAKLISVTSLIIGYFINFSIFNFFAGIIFTGLALAVGVYFLFEIKTYFK
ncbi:MAG TPA: hypothetical protein PLO25_03475 [Candidatus Saccharibacteria bacterium]|nr:hypothetical protein [Candidatus Saccharibacteria bacterium]